MDTARARTKTRDPVCGMELETGRSFATRQRLARTYYFCSQACVERFDADPQRYGLAVPSATTGAGPNGRHPVRLTLPVSGLRRADGPALERSITSVAGVTKATLSRSGYQEGTVLVKGGYTPDVIVVEKGKPVRLNFVRNESASCPEMVLIPEFNKVPNFPKVKTSLSNSCLTKRASSSFSAKWACFAAS